MIFIYLQSVFQNIPKFEAYNTTIVVEIHHNYITQWNVLVLHTTSSESLSINVTVTNNYAILEIIYSLYQQHT